MPSRRAKSQAPLAPPETLKKVIRRVLREQSAAVEDLAPDTVHDLRVALRRCRSLAEGFSQIDDHRDWRKLSKAAKRLQGGLAGIRDSQVISNWVRRFQMVDGAHAKIVKRRLDRDEEKAIAYANDALADFPRTKWKRLRKRLPQRAENVPNSVAAFAKVALQRAGDAAGRERRWRGHESQAATHSLRIAVKEFRYTVESFQPELHAKWKPELKTMQDVLGEIHDLDVLLQWIAKLAKKESLDRETVRDWNHQINHERKLRVEKYQKRSNGSDRWHRWQEELAGSGGLNPSDYEPSSA